MCVCVQRVLKLQTLYLDTTFCHPKATNIPSRVSSGIETTWSSNLSHIHVYLKLQETAREAILDIVKRYVRYMCYDDYYNRRQTFITSTMIMVNYIALADRVGVVCYIQQVQSELHSHSTKHNFIEDILVITYNDTVTSFKISYKLAQAILILLNNYLSLATTLFYYCNSPKLKCIQSEAPFVLPWL